MKQSKYNIFYKNDNGTYIIYNTRTLALSILSKKEYEILKDLKIIEKVNGETEFLNDLYESGFILDDVCDELKILKNRLGRERYSERLLRLTIAPTLNCNFDCPYCYEKLGDEKDITLMNSVVRNAILDFIDKRTQTVKEVSMVWYGGEPLLGFDIIEEMSERIIEICKNKGIYYSAIMITNGYFLDKYKPEDFLRLKIENIQVTLDGTEKSHDKRRILKNGKGTYKKILSNIKLFSDKIHFIIRYNLDKENYSELNNFIEDIKYENINNFEINLAPVSNYENPDDPKCYCTKDFSRIWVDFDESCKKSGVSSGNIMVPAASHYCDADFENGFIIDQLGYIYKCWQDIGIKEKNIGNILHTEQKFSELYYNYMTYDATEDPKCQECKILPICMGGCPFERVHGEERCCRYKYVLEHIIKNMAYV